MLEHHDAGVWKRAHALHSYIQALETGDGAVLSATLRQAQGDAILEQLILALHSMYLDVEEIAIHPEEVAQARELIQAPAHENGRHQVGNRYGDTAMPPRRWERERERRIRTMRTGDEIPETPRTDEQEMSGVAESLLHSPLMTPPQSANGVAATPRSRAVVFLQAIAAVLVVAVMVGSFYVLFSSHLIQRGKGIDGSGHGGISRTGVTLASGEGVVLVGSRDSDVLAVRAHDGALVWRYATGTDYPITALAALDGVVYSNTENGDIAAVRIADGKVLWNRNFNQFEGFPDTIALVGSVLVVPSPQGPVALRASDGVVLWRDTSDRFVGAGEGAVYVGSDEIGTPTSITTSPTQMHRVKALRISDGKLLWSYTPQQSGEDASTAYAANGVVYLGTFSSNSAALTALHASDGTRIWTQSENGLGAPFFASEQVVRTRTDTGICSYRADLGVRQWCTPAPSLDRAFTADNENVYLCRYEGNGNQSMLAVGTLNGSDGSQRWYWRSEPQRPLTGANNRYGISIGSSGPGIVAFDGDVYVGATEGVYGIHGSDGHQLWHTLDSENVMTLLAAKAG